MTIALYAEFTAVEGSTDAVVKLIADFATVVRQEPGNLCFDAYQLADEASTIFVHERYADQAAFDTHLASEAGRVFNIALAPLVIGGGSALTMLSPIEVPIAGEAS
jgi:quinol monooxygenase YgiN